MVEKLDPNTELFQFRVFQEKEKNCKKQWITKWGWIVDEIKEQRVNLKRVREEALGVPEKVIDGRTVKPIPETTSGEYGWIAQKPEFNYGYDLSWRPNIPIHLPEVWEQTNYKDSSESLQ